MIDSLSKTAGQILELLPRNGKPIGNIHIRRQLEVSVEKFREARGELIDKGLVTPGKGRGGSLSRLDDGSVARVEQGLPIDNLVQPHLRFGKAELKRRREPAKDPAEEFENQAWQLVYHLSPRFITTGSNPTIHLHTKFQPDLVALFSEFVLVCDCKNTTHGTYVSDWLDKVEYFRDELFSMVKDKGFKQVIYVCVVKDSQTLDEKVNSRAKKLKVRLLDSARLLYFLSLQREAGVGIRHLFWGTVAPSVVHLQEERIPALSVKLGRKREAFVFSVNAHRLLPRAIISHRELHDPYRGVTGYQRMLKRSRLGALAKYIEKYKTFPTPIVVALEKNTRFDPGKEEESAVRSRMGHVWLSAKPATVQIIDGQHRLLGYSLVEEDEDHFIHVIGYRNNEDLDPASMFVDINAKQKAVPSGLLWELYPDIYPEESPDYYRAMISKSVEQAVAETKDIRTFITHISSRIRGPITFQAICSEIPKSNLLTKKGGLVRSEAEGDRAQVNKLHQWLKVFFDALTSLEPQFRKVLEVLLLRNVGIVPALRLFGRILSYERGIGNQSILKNNLELTQQLTAYLRVICEHYDQKPVSELEQMRSRSSSQGGFKRMFEEFVEIIDKGYRPGFGGPKVSGQLSSLGEQVISAIDEINRKGVSLGITATSIFKEFDSKELRRITRKKELDIDAFEKLVIKLHQEVIEGSGEHSPNNRLARLLGATELPTIPILGKLHSLRVYFSHKGALIDAPKRKAAVEALQSLLGSTALKDPTELSPPEFNLAACNLLSEVANQVLTPAISKITNQ